MLVLAGDEYREHGERYLRASRRKILLVSTRQRRPHQHGIGYVLDLRQPIRHGMRDGNVPRREYFEHRRVQYFPPTRGMTAPPSRGTSLPALCAQQRIVIRSRALRGAQRPPYPAQHLRGFPDNAGSFSARWISSAVQPGKARLSAPCDTSRAPTHESSSPVRSDAGRLGAGSSGTSTHTSGNPHDSYRPSLPRAYVRRVGPPPAPRRAAASTPTSMACPEAPSLPGAGTESDPLA